MKLIAFLLICIGLIAYSEAEVKFAEDCFCCDIRGYRFPAPGACEDFGFGVWIPSRQTKDGEWRHGRCNYFIPPPGYVGWFRNEEWDGDGLNSLQGSDVPDNLMNCGPNARCCRNPSNGMQGCVPVFTLCSDLIGYIPC